MEQQVDKKDLFAIRELRMDDLNLIFSTWLRGLYYGDSWFSLIEKKVFMDNYHTILERLLTSGTARVRITCLKDDPEVILGYAVLGNPGVLHWVFVKSAWRGIGIAKGMIPEDTTAITHLTKLGVSYLKSHNKLTFNPFIQ